MQGAGYQGPAEPGDQSDGQTAERRRKPAVTGGDSDRQGEDEAGGGGGLGIEQGEAIGTADETDATGDAGKHPTGKAELGTDEEEADGGEEESAIGIE